MAVESSPNPRSKHAEHAHLLSLPRELRDAIYDFCIPSPPVIEMTRTKHPQWLLACKQIFLEAAALIYDQCCIYKAIDYDEDRDLSQQLMEGYSRSFPDCHAETIRQTFDQVKNMVSYVALDVHLNMSVEEMTWLSDHYLANISQLPNLKALYICLNVRPGVERNSFKQKLARSDLRIFQLVSLLQPVESLMNHLPKNCKIRWSVPETIRWSANGETFDYREGNVPFVTIFMEEVQHAVVATKQQDGGAEVQDLTEPTAEMSLRGGHDITQ